MQAGRGPLLAAAVLFAALLAPPAYGQAAPTEQAQAFDIPAQPLGAALKALGAQTSLNILYGPNVVTGQTSTAVRGTIGRERALGSMLQGTGLLFRFTGQDAALVFTPSQVPDAVLTTGRSTGAVRMFLGVMPVKAAPMIGARPASYLPYGRTVQAAINQRLDADPHMHGQTFKAVLGVRVDANGEIHFENFAHASGNAAIDHAITLAVEGAAAPGAPPADMPQPIWFELDSQ